MELVVRIELLRLSFDAFLTGQSAFLSKIMRTLVAEAFVNGFMGALLPDGERRATMRTKIFGAASLPDASGGSKMIADFATDLIAFLAIIEVKEVGGSIAVFAPAMLRNAECRRDAEPALAICRFVFRLHL